MADKFYRCQIGAFKQKSDADAMAKKVNAKGFDTVIKEVGKFFKVQTGVSKTEEDAENLAEKVKAAGFDCFVVKPDMPAPTPNKSYQEFYETHLNKGYNIDGAFGWQCWDGYAEYCNYLGVPYANCNVSGYVKDIWEQKYNNGMTERFGLVGTMQPGDIAVFKESPSTPSSHIAIFHGDAGNGYGWFFGQNQGSPITNPEGGSAFNLCKLPYSATFDTAFRPML